MKTFCLIDKNGNVVDRIVSEDISKWATPKGVTLVEDVEKIAAIGDKFLKDENAFQKPLLVRDENGNETMSTEKVFNGSR